MESRDQEHRRALEVLYLDHERGLYNAAYRYVWNSDEARDVVHDAFVRLWGKRDTIDWSRAGGLAYRTVLGIASNRRRAARVRGWFSRPDDDATESAPAGGTNADELLAAARLDASVRACIDELPERLRSVLVMTTFSELDHAEVADALGIPVGTVGSRRNEAIARIRGTLSEADHG